MKSKGSPDTLTRWREFIEKHYSLEDLRALCFELQIEYENLDANETRRDKTRALLLYLGREGKFEQLVEYIQETRPDALGAANLPANPEVLYQDLEQFETLTRPLHQVILERIGVEQRAGLPSWASWSWAL